jgi:DNA-binding CsgD family transcriptional regulator
MVEKLPNGGDNEMNESGSEGMNYFFYMNLARQEYQNMLKKYPEIASLSPRELEVFSYLFSDKTLAEIAEELFITYSSVHFHCKNIYRKLGVSGRRQILIKYKDI